ncbi:hypothetical protein I4U23_005285 [Adineta vaga]|nr:hypothetical protein I4U23_005285 [Adineta vaga]
MSCTNFSDNLLTEGVDLKIQNFPSQKPSFFEHAEKADVCLVLGSSIRVPLAAYVPQRVSERGGKLAMDNLQLTSSAPLAQLNIHALCDDLMRGLMAKLDISIPDWELHRRVRAIIQKQRIKIMGLDVDQDISYTLFFESRESIEHKIPVNDSTGNMDVYIELHWQGNYNEPMYTLRT